MERPTEKKRLGRKVLYIEEDRLLELFAGRVAHEQRDHVCIPAFDRTDIPTTARVCGVYYEPRMGCFSMVVEDESWPVAEPGLTTPAYRDLPVSWHMIQIFKLSVREKMQAHIKELHRERELYEAVLRRVELLEVPKDLPPGLTALGRITEDVRVLRQVQRAALGAEIERVTDLMGVMGAAGDFLDGHSHGPPLEVRQPPLPSLLELARDMAPLSAAWLQPHPPRPKIVCLCGSTRFMEAFREANAQETLAGNIVLSIGVDFKGAESRKLTADDKGRLDELHFRKIDLADEVLFLNVDGYMGESTRRELAYARNLGKAVRFLCPPPEGAAP